MMNKKKICLLVFVLTLGLVTACSKGGKNSKDDKDTYETASEELMTTEEPSDRIIVTLGDSYAAGEGIEPFYGQLKTDLVDSGDYFGKLSGMFSEDETNPVSEKAQSEDWLAHRSQYAWPGMLTLPSVEGNMAENRGTHWYTKASSGAVTHNIIGYDVDEKGKKNYDKYIDHIFNKEKDCKQLKEVNRDGEKNKVSLEPQIKVFDELTAEGKKADYVIISIGGNDVGFSAVVGQVMIGSWYYDKSNLQEMVDDAADLVKEGGAVREDLKRTYREVAEAAGPQATLIVVGYSELYDRYGKGTFVSKDEAWIVDDGVLLFNKEIESIVEECRAEGINIEYVSVVEAFGTIDAEGNIIDPQHQAYSDDEYIQSVTFGAKDEDLLSNAVFSSYSMHPNLRGALTYAECVQKKIDELEEEKGNIGEKIDQHYRKAYLYLLQQNKTEIKNYNWQDHADSSASKQVALYDICGDGTPELFYITAGAADADAELHIYTYSEGEAVEIYKTKIDSTEESSNLGYVLFSTKFTREIYLFSGYSEPEETSVYKKLSYQGSKLVEKPFISAETSEEDSGSEVYSYKDSSISQKKHKMIEKYLLFAAKDIVLCDDDYSEHMTTSGSLGSAENASMSYDEAVKLLDEN